MLPAIQNTKITETHLSLRPGTTEDEWTEIAYKLTEVGYGYWWWIGDLAAYARHNFEAKVAREKFTELGKAIGCQIGYIHMLANTCKLYPVRDRVRGLSIRHHELVQNLPPGKRREWLKKAATKGWPARILEEHIQPEEKRTFTVMIKVPMKYKSSKDLMSRLTDISETYNAKFHIYGDVRHSKARIKNKGVPRTIAASI